MPIAHYVQRWWTNLDALVGSELLINIFEKDTHFMEENRIRIVNPKDTNNFWDNFAKYFVGGCKE